MLSDAVLPWVVALLCAYLPYVHWLGATGPLQSIRTMSRSAASSHEVAARLHRKRVEVWRAGAALSALCSEMYCTTEVLIYLLKLSPGGKSDEIGHPLYDILYIYV